MTVVRGAANILTSWSMREMSFCMAMFGSASHFLVCFSGNCAVGNDGSFFETARVEKRSDGAEEVSRLRRTHVTPIDEEILHVLDVEHRPRRLHFVPGPVVLGPNVHHHDVALL